MRCQYQQRLSLTCLSNFINEKRHLAVPFLLLQADACSEGVANAQAECLVARASFDCAAPGVAGAVLVLDANICGVQVGTLRQGVAIADCPLIRILVCNRLDIVANMGRQNRAGCRCCAAESCSSPYRGRRRDVPSQHQNHRFRPAKCSSHCPCRSQLSCRYCGCDSRSELPGRIGGQQCYCR